MSTEKSCQGLTAINFKAIYMSHLLIVSHREVYGMLILETRLGRLDNFFLLYRSLKRNESKLYHLEKTPKFPRIFLLDVTLHMSG